MDTQYKDEQIFPELSSYLRTLGTRSVRRSKSHTEDPQTSGITIIDLITMESWHLGFVYSCLNVLKCADN
jgi:hypothetical protein